MAIGGDGDAPSIRAGRDDDARGLIALVGACWSEYPGCVLDVDGEVPELRAIATYFARRNGRFWVADRGGRAVGCIGVVPAQDPGRMELLKLYVAAGERRRGLGSRLCGLVEDEARRRGARLVELWSDTRFGAAHRLYEARGYVRSGETRELHDLSNTIESYFAKLVGG